jgi:cell division protein FtsN
VNSLGRAPLDGDDSYERSYLAGQSWMRVASKGKASKTDAAFAVSSLPRENPENLTRPWTQAAPQELPAQETPASASAEQGWKATTKAAAAAQPKAADPAPTAALGAPQSTGSLPPPLAQPKPQPGGVVIQAGSFKNKENADKARTALGGLAPVEVTPIQVGGNVYYRVRVGPFSAASGTNSVLARVRSAGYQGAKIVAGD